MKDYEQKYYDLLYKVKKYEKLLSDLEDENRELKLLKDMNIKQVIYESVKLRKENKYDKTRTNSRIS